MRRNISWNKYCGGVPKGDSSRYKLTQDPPFWIWKTRRPQARRTFWLEVAFGIVGTFSNTCSSREFSFRRVEGRDAHAAAIPRFLNLFVELSNKCVRLSRGILSGSDAIPGVGCARAEFETPDEWFSLEVPRHCEIWQKCGELGSIFSYYGDDRMETKIVYNTKPIFFSQFIIVK